MKKQSLLLIILAFLSNAFGQSQERNIREWSIFEILSSESLYLIWTEEFDSTSNRTRRSCLVLTTSYDSIDHPLYTVAQYRSYGPDFEEWAIPVVYRHPSKDRQREVSSKHYTIKREETYDHVPSPTELASVWNRGSHYFEMNMQFQQQYLKMNKNLWYEYFDHPPSLEEIDLFR